MNSERNLITFRRRISREMAFMPVDKIIVAVEKRLSRRQIRKALDNGAVTLNGRRVRVASVKPKAGDILEFRYWDTVSGAKPGLSTGSPSFSRDQVLYHENGLIIVNKPPLLASQQTKNPRDSFVIRELEKLRSKEAEFSPEGLFLCHRLDKETSGVLMLAESTEKTEALMNQFRERKTKKKYLALCYGVPAKKSWEHRCFLSPIDKKSGQVRVVRSGGKASLTKFRLVESFPGAGVSLIACFPETGRGHQIRVHLESCGHPILGDKRYGDALKTSLPEAVEKCASVHHMLHAEKLGFFPGDACPMQWVTAPLPAGFSEILKYLKD